MEARIAAAEEQGRSVTALNDRLAALQKERDELQGTVRSLKREASPEFKAKYEQPFNDAAEFAKSQVESLEIVTQPGDPEAGVAPVTRQAKWEDFAALYQMPLNKAIATAKQVFGDSAQTVINHLSELQRLGYQRDKALKEEQGKAKAREDEELANRSQQQEQIAKLWRDYNAQIADRDPEFFQPDPKDTEAAEILQEGYRVVDSVHNAKALTMQQKIRLDAEIRNRAAAHPLMVHRLTQARSRIAELEAQVAELKGSAPGSTKSPGGGAAPAGEEDFYGDLRKTVGHD